jgi:hypothetical protein
MSTEYLLVGDLEFDLDDLFESADADDRLTEWEEDFIADMKERRKKYGGHVSLDIPIPYR